MKRFISSLHFFTNILMLTLIVVEFYVAGLGVFGATTYSLHRAIGVALTLISFLLLLLSLVGVLGRTRITFSTLLVILMVLQFALVNIHNPYIEALHLVNALLITGITVALIRTRDTKVAKV